VTRALRWILLAVVVGGAAFLVFYLMQDRPEAPQPQEAAPPDGDQLTEEDRRGLNTLIESKVKEKEGGRGP
jgi:uncharacterized membrane protein